jgi:hypothetical protein
LLRGALFILAAEPLRVLLKDLLYLTLLLLRPLLLPLLCLLLEKCVVRVERHRCPQASGWDRFDQWSVGVGR